MLGYIGRNLSSQLQHVFNQQLREDADVSRVKRIRDEVEDLGMGLNIYLAF